MLTINREEESLLLTALRRANENSPFWRNRLRDQGVTEADLRPGFPFHSLKPVSKADILADQRNHPPFGSLLAVPETDIRRIHKTSGTSTSPFLIALTERDIEDTYTASVRAFQHAGMGPQDRVAHCLNFNMWSGGVTDYIPIERTKATGIPFGVGNTSMLLQLIPALNINAISSTPSYMFTLRDRCREETGAPSKSLGLKRGYFGGEGLLQLPEVRAEIEAEFGMMAFDANYGMSEVTSIIAGEGIERDGLEYHTYGILFAELVDKNGATVPIEVGARGELVFSTLRRQAQPLFRYKTNDIAEILAVSIGDDGLLRMRMKVVGRTDEMIVVRGVNFFPQSIQSIIGPFEPQISRVFRVVRPHGPVDAITVALETSLPDGDERDALARRFVQRVSTMLQVRTKVAWLDDGTLPRDGNKSQFLIEADDIPALKSQS